MNSLSLLKRLGMLAIAATLLGACAETRFVMHTAKRLGDTTKSQGSYKVGSPYKVQGVWYYPSEDMAYDKTGIASWYGPNFHGKTTANGELYDQWAVTAAHKTLPLPSMVRVTNLENGRSLVVRINDRGPFVSNRIIDMSHRAAQLLGFDQKGTARVRVQVLPRESQMLAQQAKGEGVRLARNESPIQSDGLASSPVARQDLSPPVLSARAPSAPPMQSAPAPSTRVQTVPINETPVTGATTNTASVGDLAQVPVSPTRIYIQAGAFSDKTNAERVRTRLSSIGAVSVTPVPVNGRELFRVRLGPIENVDQADSLLSEVVRAGYSGARTVVENTTVD
jgi:rare lipoprotein A